MNNLEIIQQYDKEIKKLCLYYYLRNPKILSDIEDYYQEAYLTAIPVVKNYDEKQGAILPYLLSSISHALSKYAYKNNSPLKVTPEIVKISTQIFSHKQKGLSKEEICQTLNISEDKYLESETILTRGILFDNHMDFKILDNLEMDLDVILTPKEYEVFNLYRTGMNTKEVAKSIDKSEEIVRRTLNSAVSKIEKYLHE